VFARPELRVIVTASLAGLLFGFDTAVVSGVTQALRDTFALSPVGLGLAVSSALWGTLLGAAALGPAGGSLWLERCPQVCWPALFGLLTRFRLRVEFPNALALSIPHWDCNRRILDPRPRLYHRGGTRSTTRYFSGGSFR
jgi:hypothetical protein